MTDTTEGNGGGGGVVSLTLVREALEGAAEACPPAPAQEGSPPLNSDAAAIGGALGERSGGGVRGGDGRQFSEPFGHWSRGGDTPGLGLPDGCPVVPLGRDGRTYYYLDAMRQLAELKDNEHGRLVLRGLFAGKTYMLETFWPRTTAKGAVNGVDFDDMAEALMDAAAHAGVWNAEEKVRGVGAWLGRGGELVLHCGDGVRVGGELGQPGEWHPPGLVDKFVYPAAEAQPKPAETPVSGGEDSAAAWLLGLLRSWNWKRGDLDAMLALGWIGAAMIGGALKWRPMTWITGGAGTGKSTLQDVINQVHGDAIAQAADTSAAGIWQKVGHSTIPVALDELEASEDNRKVNAVVALARQASSGGILLRGGQDHKGAEFTTRSCFLFSSILMPPLQPQDLTRMAILELQPLADGAALTIDNKHLNRVGAQLRRRLVDTWADLPKILATYRDALGHFGHGNRGMDQFGTLLAVADALLIDDEIEHSRAMAWAERLDAKTLAAWTDAEADEARCLRHLLTSQIDPFRGGQRFTLVEWIERAAGWHQGTDKVEANRTLGTYGLSVEEYDERVWVHVANQHRGLDGIYQGTHWAGRSGTMGGWAQSLRRLEGASATPSPKYIGGVTTRATRIPLDTVLPEKRVSAYDTCGEAAPQSEPTQS